MALRGGSFVAPRCVGSSQIRDGTVCPGLAGRFFTNEPSGNPWWSLIAGNPTPSQARVLLPWPPGGMCVCECPSHQAHPTKVGPLPWRGPTVQRNSVNSPWGEESRGPGLSSAVRVRGGGVDAPLPFSPEGASCLPLLPSSEPTDQAATPPSSKPLSFSLLMGCKG